jgi:hypothetical protein
MPKQQRDTDRERDRRIQVLQAQDEELDALEAIYCLGEFNRLHHLEDYAFTRVFAIQLPEHTATLVFKLPREYPLGDALQVTLANTKALQLAHAQALQTHLQQVAINKTGTHCAYDIVLEAQHFILEHHFKPVSFHELMVREQHRKIQEQKDILIQQQIAQQQAMQKESFEIQEKVKKRMEDISRLQKDRKQTSRAASSQLRNSNTTSKAIPIPRDFGRENSVSSTSSRSLPNEVSRNSKRQMSSGLSKSFAKESAIEIASEQKRNSYLNPEDDEEIEIANNHDFVFELEESDVIQLRNEKDRKLDRYLSSLHDFDIRFSSDEKGIKGELNQLKAFLDAKTRYQKDFEEIRKLGKGGFGSVFEVKNRLDGLTYAIKKIKLNKKDPHSRKKIIREVTTIARLHHQHIVRYFQAWIEGGDDADEISDEGDDEDDWLQAQRTSTFETGRSDDENSSSDLSNEFLYIQMEFCPNRTLRDVIDEGISGKIETFWTLFRQILDSISYIHSKVSFIVLLIFSKLF